jgi:hypothetical protein
MGYVGLFLLIWLGTGFLIGLKGVFLNKQHIEIANTSQEEIERLKNKGRSEKNIELAIKFLSDKKTYIVCSTLMGFLALWSDLKNFSK